MVAGSRRVSEVAGGAASAGFAREVLVGLEELEWVAAGVVRSPQEVARLRARLRGRLAGWSRLLQAHAAEVGGRCRLCRSWWGGRRWWPCRVWWEAHTHLVRYRLPVQAGSQTVSGPASTPVGRPGPGQAASPSVWPGFTILSRPPGEGVR